MDSIDRPKHSSGSTRSSIVSILQHPSSSTGKLSSDHDDITTIGSFSDGAEDNSRFLSEKMLDRVRRFISRLASRTQNLKKIRPDSPSSLDSYVTKSGENNIQAFPNGYGL